MQKHQQFHYTSLVLVAGKAGGGVDEGASVIDELLRRAQDANITLVVIAIAEMVAMRRLLVIMTAMAGAMRQIDIRRRC